MDAFFKLNLNYLFNQSLWDKHILSRFQERAAKLADLKVSLDAIQDNVRKLSDSDLPVDCTELHAKVEEATKRWDDVNEKTANKLSALTAALNEVQDTKSKIRDFAKNLAAAGQGFETDYVIGGRPETTQSQLDKHQVNIPNSDLTVHE